MVWVLPHLTDNPGKIRKISSFADKRSFRLLARHSILALLGYNNAFEFFAKGEGRRVLLSIPPGSEKAAYGQPSLGRRMRKGVAGWMAEPPIGAVPSEGDFL